MRIIPILTAIFVAVVLFLFVFERDRLLDFAGAPSGDSAAEATTPDAPDAEAAPTADPTADPTATPEAVADAAAQVAPAGAVSVIAVISEAREIDSAVILRGRTEAARQVDLKAEISGKVTSAPLPKGTQVAAGEVLCELELGTRAALLAQARASMDEAALSLRNAEALKQGGFAAETRVLGARAAMQAAEAAVASATREIERTRIAAPFDGVLESDTAELGSLLQPGSLCATIVDLDPMKLVGFVAEANVERVAIGAMAGARLSSGREIIGQVTFVSRSADLNTRTFRVEAELPNTDLSIRDGQSAEIAIQSKGRAAHLLPQSTLTLDDDGTLGVRIAEAGADGDIARFVPVELLRDSREGIWVAGLPATARVIVTGQDYVTDGVPLAVTLEESGT